MFINDNHFTEWMQHFDKRMDEFEKNQKLFIRANDVFDKDDKLLDNQDLCLLLHISPRTLQRYRSQGCLKHMKFGQKIYYRVFVVREFINQYGSPWEKNNFETSTKPKSGE
jgi:hypothetical protein